MNCLALNEWVFSCVSVYLADKLTVNIGVNNIKISIGLNLNNYMIPFICRETLAAEDICNINCWLIAALFPSIMKSAVFRELKASAWCGRAGRLAKREYGAGVNSFTRIIIGADSVAVCCRIISGISVVRIKAYSACLRKTADLTLNCFRIGNGCIICSVTVCADCCCFKRVKIWAGICIQSGCWINIIKLCKRFCYIICRKCSVINSEIGNITIKHKVLSIGRNTEEEISWF